MEHEWPKLYQSVHKRPLLCEDGSGRLRLPSGARVPYAQLCARAVLWYEHVSGMGDNPPLDLTKSMGSPTHFQATLRIAISTNFNKSNNISASAPPLHFACNAIQIPIAIWFWLPRNYGKLVFRDMMSVTPGDDKYTAGALQR